MEGFVVSERDEKMAKAFALVCPLKCAERLVKAGWLSEENLKKVSWRDRIAAVVTDAELAEAGVTIAEVREAVAFYTATEASVSRERIAKTLPNKRGKTKNELGYLVMADGYRAGPAGP